MTMPLLPTADEGLEFFENIISTWKNSTAAFFKSKKTSVGTIAFQPFPKSFGVHAASTGGTAMGLSTSDGNRFIIEQCVLHKDAEDDEAVYTMSQSITKSIESMRDTLVKSLQSKASTGGAKIETYMPYFQNDAMYDQDVFASYKDVDALRALQRETDPTGMFSKRIGGFRL
jgi:hypothetical protein